MLSLTITILIIVILITLLLLRANRLKRTLSVAENDALNEDYLSHGTRKSIEDPKNI